MRFEGGTVTNLDRTDQAPDVTLTIQAFSRLLLGVYDTQAIRFMGDVAVHTSLERLSPLFYRKPVYITEYF